jgi:outer membrane lipoprotein-sorting protein
MTRRAFAAASSIFAAALVATPSAQTIEDLIAKHVKSKGGIERIRSLKALRITGSLSPAEGIDMPIFIVSERPNKVRQETSFQGQQMITAFDGEKAWTLNPMMGISTPSPMQGPELDVIRDQADLDGPFVDTAAKGITLEMQGTETVEGQQTHKVKVTRKSGRSQILYVSADTGLEIKSVTEVEQAGMKLTVESFFSDYRPIEGMPFAHRITQKISGGPQPTQLNIKIDKVEMVPDIEDATFAMPAKP